MLHSMRSAAKYVWIFLIIAFIGGFLLVETSGLLGRAPITTSTVVAEVNGRDIPYTTWANAVQQRVQQEEQQGGRGLTLDDRERLEAEVFEQMVSQILLEQEYERRGIRVTEDEIVAAAQYSPPPQLLQASELQTDGRFDIEKYQRFLRSPAARQQGLLYQMESYYRTEIPRQKLFEQIASDVYITDARLWQAYRDQHDSAQVTYVAFDPTTIPDSAVSVTDAELRSYYDANRRELTRTGRAVVSVLTVPRIVSAADSATVRARAMALRQEILGGATFEDVARRESDDTLSGSQGGVLPRGARGRFDPEFEKAAYSLEPGELSEPVSTRFGVHLIRVDEQKGDTLALRHILLRFEQSDSSAALTARRADSLAAIAANAERPSQFDSAAKVLGLTPEQGVVIEGQPLTIAGRYVPSVSAWAFGGAKVNETSDQFDTEDAYYVARLDSLTEGGELSFDAAKPDIRRLLSQRKKLDRLIPTAQQLAQQAKSTSLETAARAAGLTASQTPMFTRTGFVGGLGRLNEAIGAAFALPLVSVSVPIRTLEGVFVLRVDRRVEADSAEFEKQKGAQRDQLTEGARQQRVRAFMESLRREAKIEDHRKEINAAARRES